MEITPDLVAAYHRTRFDILLGDKTVTLSVSGIVTGEIELVRGRRIAIITAYNPATQRPSKEEKEAANDALSDFTIHAERTGSPLSG